MTLLNKNLFLITLLICAAFLIREPAVTHAQSASSAAAKERARVVLSTELPHLDGDNLKAILVEVNYGPGESSPAHSHPCAVLGYVAAGRLRTQLQGQPEKIYKAGESFYEPPNGAHLVSANASSVEPAKLIAYVICDHNVPLSVNFHQPTQQKGSSR